MILGVFISGVVGCSDPNTIAFDRDKASSLLTRDVDAWELKYKSVQATLPSNYDSEYRNPHLKRLFDASVYFDLELEKLKKDHKDTLGSIEREMVDLKVKRNSAPENMRSQLQLELTNLISKKKSTISKYDALVSIVNTNKTNRINQLNKLYLEVLTKDFPVD